VREHLDLSGGQRCTRMLSVDLVLHYLNTLYCGGLACRAFQLICVVGRRHLVSHRVIARCFCRVTMS
jgi:hypothetical protein